MSTIPPQYKSSDSLPEFSSLSFLGEEVSEERSTVQEILSDIKKNGWESVKKYSRRYDDHVPSDNPIESEHLSEAWDDLSDENREAFRITEDRIRRYQNSIKPDSTILSDGSEGFLGEIARPLETVGCYIPGGRFPLPSTVFMTVLVAEIAGVSNLIVCTPPGDKDGRPHTEILAALSRVTNLDVFSIGGAQAIGAMAFGVGPISQVDLIAGPGNLYVTLAKKEVFGSVGVDLLAGPSEITVIANSKYSNPEWVAADLLSQAEHDPRARCFLITDETTFLENVHHEVHEFLEKHPNRDIVEKSLKNSALIETKDIDEAIGLSNEIAPEHLELHLYNAAELAKKCINAGAIFCGAGTPEPMGDYVAGPNHTLPTSGGARFFSPLSVRTFIKFQSLLKTDPEKYGDLSQAGQSYADMESLWAHELSLKVRENS